MNNGVVDPGDGVGAGLLGEMGIQSGVASNSNGGIFFIDFAAARRFGPSVKNILYRGSRCLSRGGQVLLIGCRIVAVQAGIHVDSFSVAVDPGDRIGLLLGPLSIQGNGCLPNGSQISGFSGFEEGAGTVGFGVPTLEFIAAARQSVNIVLHGVFFGSGIGHINHTAGR